MSEPDDDRTRISVTGDLADELHDRKNRGDSYEDGIWRLIAAADKLAELDIESDDQEAAGMTGFDVAHADKQEYCYGEW